MKKLVLSMMIVAFAILTSCSEKSNSVTAPGNENINISDRAIAYTDTVTRKWESIGCDSPIWGYNFVDIGATSTTTGTNDCVYGIAYGNNTYVITKYNTDLGYFTTASTPLPSTFQPSKIEVSKSEELKDVVFVMGKSTIDNKVYIYRLDLAKNGGDNFATKLSNYSSYQPTNITCNEGGNLIAIYNNKPYRLSTSNTWVSVSCGRTIKSLVENIDYGQVPDKLDYVLGTDSYVYQWNTSTGVTTKTTSSPTFSILERSQRNMYQRDRDYGIVVGLKTLTTDKDLYTYQESLKKWVKLSSLMNLKSLLNRPTAISVTSAGQIYVLVNGKPYKADISCIPVPVIVIPET